MRMRRTKRDAAKCSFPPWAGSMKIGGDRATEKRQTISTGNTEQSQPGKGTGVEPERETPEKIGLYGRIPKRVKKKLIFLCATDKEDKPEEAYHHCHRQGKGREFGNLIAVVVVTELNMAD